jgi:hypothetical protein
LLLAGLGIGGYLAYSGAVTSPVFVLILFLGVFNTFSRYFGANSQVIKKKRRKIERLFFKIFSFYLGKKSGVFQGL